MPCNETKWRMFRTHNDMNFLSEQFNEFCRKRCKTHSGCTLLKAEPLKDFWCDVVVRRTQLEVECFTRENRRRRSIMVLSYLVRDTGNQVYCCTKAVRLCRSYVMQDLESDIFDEALEIKGSKDQFMTLNDEDQT